MNAPDNRFMNVYQKGGIFTSLLQRYNNVSKILNAIKIVQVENRNCISLLGNLYTGRHEDRGQHLIAK